MTKQVTVTLPDQLYENAQHWATLTQRDLSQTLADALMIVLTPVFSPPRLEHPITSLSDAEVAALTRLRMDERQGKRLGVLLERKREDSLTPAESSELMALMQIYHQLWIRQSEALVEAVRRGLRPSLGA